MQNVGLGTPSWVFLSRGTRVMRQSTISTRLGVHAARASGVCKHHQLLLIAAWLLGAHDPCQLHTTVLQQGRRKH